MNVHKGRQKPKKTNKQRSMEMEVLLTNHSCFILLSIAGADLNACNLQFAICSLPFAVCNLLFAICRCADVPMCQCGDVAM